MARRRSVRARLAKDAREALGLNQAQFAGLLGVPRATPSRWEAGERDPGTLGEDLLALVLDSPVRSKKVLRQLRDQGQPALKKTGIAVPVRERILTAHRKLAAGPTKTATVPGNRSGGQAS